MPNSSVTTQTATSASGAVAIVSASASERMTDFSDWGVYIAAFSAAIMCMSFAWSIYSSRKKSRLIAIETKETKRLADEQAESNRIERQKLQLEIEKMNKKMAS